MKVDRITSSSLVPAAGGDTTNRPAGDDVEMKDLTKQGVKDKEDVVVSWQQKIFSQVLLLIFCSFRKFLLLSNAVCKFIIFVDGEALQTGKYLC